MGIGRQEAGGEGREGRKRQEGKEIVDVEGLRIPGRGGAMQAGRGGTVFLYPEAARVVLGNSTHGRAAPE